MVVEEGDDPVLVLLAVERAGAVDEHAVWGEQRGGLAQQPGLTAGRAGDRGRAPVAYRGWPATEQPFAGARRVEHDAVERRNGAGQAMQRRSGGDDARSAPQVEAR